MRNVGREIETPWIDLETLEVTLLEIDLSNQLTTEQHLHSVEFFPLVKWEES